MLVLEDDIDAGDAWLAFHVSVQLCYEVALRTVEVDCLDVMAVKDCISCSRRHSRTEKTAVRVGREQTLCRGIGLLDRGGKVLGTMVRKQRRGTRLLLLCPGGRDVDIGVVTPLS